MRYTLNKLKNITAEELNSMTAEELKEYVKQGKKASEYRRKRALDAYERGDIALSIAYADFKPSKDSPTTISYRTYEFGGGTYEEIENFNIQILRKEAKVIKSFLNTKTSTISGWKQNAKSIYNRVINALSKFGYPEEDLKKIKVSSFYNRKSEKFWKLYDKWKELRGGDFSSYVGGSDQAQIDLYEMFIVNKNTQGLPPDEILAKLLDVDTARYEKSEIEDNADFEDNDYYSIKF